MEFSTFIGSSIFFYIAALFVVTVVGVYFTYRVSPKRKQRQEDKRNRDNLK
ncbi:MAG: hypothetical protein J7J29_02935 [Psychrobacter sp.]|nr:hypothetical protein [Psychrobacter sp.]